MSQITKMLTSAGPIPPIIATSYVTQDGTAVPAANILILHGIDSTENNDNGIILKGGLTGTGTSNEVDVVLTNRVTGSVTTSNATPTAIITFPLGATAGVYFLTGDIVGFDITDVAGGAYSFSSAVRTTGASGVEIATEFKDVLEEAAMMNADFTVAVVGNNLVISVIGILAKTINWNAFLTYRFIG